MKVKNPLGWIEEDHLLPKDPKKICRKCPRCGGGSEQAAAEDAEIPSRLCEVCFNGLSEREINILGLAR